MKKISLTSLETARKNPVAFAKSLDSDDGNRVFGSYPKFLRWRNALNTYLTSGDIASAVNELEESLSRYSQSARSRREHEKLIESLTVYSNEHQRLGYVMLEKMKKVEIEMGQGSAGALIASGQVPLICLNVSGGYSAFFFIKEDIPWYDELKYPIVQDNIATEIYGVSTSIVEVGVFSLRTNTHSTKIFSQSEIRDAKTELRTIGNKILSVLK
jgi:hypothetical protein